MHELGLCDAVVDAVLRQAAGRRVTALRLRIGGHPVDPEVIRQGIAVAAAGTVAEDVEVDLVMQPMRVLCARCGNDSPVEDHVAMVACPRCGGVDVEVVGDEQVLLESIVVEPAGGDRAAWTPSSC